tara:strand:+ start:1790 stop:4036 length:2247 start_codon:yes stop_codon:yes gene_type:complete
MTYSKSAWVMVLFTVLVFNGIHAQFMVHGHVYVAETNSPCSDAVIKAWPCGIIFSTDYKGAFSAQCDTGIDSLTVISHGFTSKTITVSGMSHIDIPLSYLSFDLNQITVLGESNSGLLPLDPTLDLMQTLDSRPGIRSLDLGSGLIQPVLRGLMGSRVSILDGGVPLVGGRWGQDHGVLVDPILYDGIEWVPGGGNIWVGPNGVGGALKFNSIRMMPSEGFELKSGLSYRYGDGQEKIYALYRELKENTQWHCGFSYSRFGDRNVPQSSFEYIGRLYNLENGRLPNTSGFSHHFVVGFIDNKTNGSQLSLDFRFSEINQGLFPGIIGVPTQNQLSGDGDVYSIDLPTQNAKRTQLTGKWVTEKKLKKTIKFSISSNLRIESAPPHAHGYGPEPENNLSLLLSENHLFAECNWEGYHKNFGIQYESLRGSTDGWEFLIPNHFRDRLSTIFQYNFSKSNIGARFDVINLGNDGYSEPLYNSNNEVVGQDVRAFELQSTKPSWAISLERPINLNRFNLSITGTAYSRVPSNYALAANGIHHGTFRFEQGNQNLQPEKSFEARISLRSSSKNFNIDVQSFASLHKGFIHLKPSASFAPISHGGQIYVFQATDAFRTGLEMNVNFQRGKSLIKTTSSLLGQWALETGLGLPFTPPLDLFNSYSYSIRDNLSLTLSHRAIAPSYLLARNEDFTEGVSLFGFELELNNNHGRFYFKVDNIFDKSWLDHVSAYRALGLVAQGKWWVFSWSKNIKSN